MTIHEAACTCTRFSDADRMQTTVRPDEGQRSNITSVYRLIRRGKFELNTLDKVKNILLFLPQFLFLGLWTEQECLEDGPDCHLCKASQRIRQGFDETGEEMY